MAAPASGGNPNKQNSPGQRPDDTQTTRTRVDEPAQPVTPLLERALHVPVVCLVLHHTLLSHGAAAGEGAGQDGTVEADG